MEELKCFLLGFGSYSLASHSDQDATAANPFADKTGTQQLLSSTTSSAPMKRERAHSTASKDAAAESSPAAWLSPALRCQLHPAEVHLLSELLPLGKQYAVLAAAAQDTAVGRSEGLYVSAVGAAIARILQLYAVDVKRAATPSALMSLRATYGMTFDMLVAMVGVMPRTCGDGDAGVSGPEPDQEQRVRDGATPQLRQQSEEAARTTATGALLSAIQAFVSNKEVPLSFRQIVGVCVWRSVLYTTAHYVAHGVVLHGRKDYFISVTPAAAGRTSEQHTLHTDLLPAGVSVDLGLLILTAGKERRVLLNEADTRAGGTDHLEQLAMGVKDVAADAVFRAIFNLTLCEGGVLAADQLTARVEAARALWSKALWTKVGSSSSLAEHLEALQVVFLCTRGDMWLAFVERCFDALSGMDSTGATLTSRHGVMVPLTPSDRQHWAAAAAAAGAGRKGVFSWAAAQRSVTEAFTYALSASGLVERSVYENYRVFLASPQSQEEEEEMYGARASRSVEATAQLLLDRARSIGVRFAAPQGLQLIVSQKAISYYQRLFSLHVGVRFTTHAMNLTRQLFAGAIVTNKRPSADLRRAYALFQLLYFLLTTVSHYFQVDVIAMPSAELQQHVQQCHSVEEAKRRHDRFIWRVAEGSFLTEGSEALHAACRALCECAVTLFVLCNRYRLNYWAVEGLNHTPVEVAASLAALETRVEQKVVAALTVHLSTSTRPAERALWARVDFNRFFSYRPGSRGGTGMSNAATMGFASWPLSSAAVAASTGTTGRWKASDEAAGTSATGGFAQPRPVTAAPGVAPATTETTSHAQTPPPRARSARRGRRSTSASASTTSRRTKHAATSTARDEEGGTGEEGVASHETSVEGGGRTVITSPATKYKKTET